MKAITISQPWASLIASGDKLVENRSWYTHYRGPLAIHAGKGIQYLSKAELAGYPHGCVIAVAELVACFSIDEILSKCAIGKTAERAPGTTRTWLGWKTHPYTEGAWCWILESVKQIETPIPANGKQGLWEWEGPTDLTFVERACA